MYLLRGLPRCEGIEILDQPVQFAWPNIELRLKELEGAVWGYYACPQSQSGVSAFYREKMPNPPFLMTETNWVERTEGTLGVYYHSASQMWAYLWVVPQPSNAQAAYVIVAQVDDYIFKGGECRLVPPDGQGLILENSLGISAPTAGQFSARKTKGC